MPSTIHDLIFVLQVFFPIAISLEQGLYVIAAVAAIFPLLRLHRNQRTEPQQPARTAWFKSVVETLSQSFDPDANPDLDFLAPDDNPGNVAPEIALAEALAGDIDSIYELLDIENGETPKTKFFPDPPLIIITERLSCAVCPSDEIHTLRRREKPQAVRLLDKDYKWRDARLFAAHCPRCRSDYYPDRYTFKSNDIREQKLEYDTEYLRVSKNGVWIHRSIAVAQERAVFRFHSGWSNFANWLNDILKSKPDITARQSRKLFLEHFSRRLLVEHGKTATFACDANPNSALLAECVREVIGKNGGVLPDSLHHGCIECTHKKRYRSDLVAEGTPVDDNSTGVVDMPPVEAEAAPVPMNNPLPEQLPNLPDVHEQPEDEVDGGARGYVRMAVMDGKTIGHRKCALAICEKPLVNYKNGRFCHEHLGLKNKCGIIPCGRDVATPGALTCDNPDHKSWHESYLRRFSRLSYPGVRRVMRRQQAAQDAREQAPRDNMPTLQVQQQLPQLQDTPGDEVVHTFRARSVYCLQTVQWACGIPIGWGKCYRSESSPQVLGIITRIWDGNEHLRPSFIAYDDACDLLRHIVTQDPHSTWIQQTKFIVDAWHYIGHKATDVLCRLWCNPAPTNGSQPDLVLTSVDDHGTTHTTRAFNTETAEQLNSWLDGYEAQLRQMSDVHYDFFVHSILMLYKEDIVRRIVKKEQELPDDFFDE